MADNWEIKHSNDKKEKCQSAEVSASFFVLSGMDYSFSVNLTGYGWTEGDSEANLYAAAKNTIAALESLQAWLLLSSEDRPESLEIPDGEEVKP